MEDSERTKTLHREGLWAVYRTADIMLLRNANLPRRSGSRRLWKVKSLTEHLRLWNSGGKPSAKLRQRPALPETRHLSMDTRPKTEDVNAPGSMNRPPRESMF